MEFHHHQQQTPHKMKFHSFGSLHDAGRNDDVVISPSRKSSKCIPLSIILHRTIIIITSADQSYGSKLMPSASLAHSSDELGTDARREWCG
ncbi:hypothetical protein ACFX2A_038674 [Malus domestica]